MLPPLKEVQTMLDAEDKTALIDAFYQNLEFGTGGLRGIMGAGTNRMNKYIVGMATQGFANYILKAFPGKQCSVVVGHDCRNNGRMFAETVADIFSANGIKVYLFESLRPTPEISFAIRQLGCQAGVNVTASHKFSRKFEIYGGWIYHSGNRMTVGSQGKYLGTGTRSDGKTMYYYEKAFTGPNNIKLPDYHRLDVGMNFIKQRHDGKIRTWNLSIYNVYCRMNTVYADVGINEDGEYVGESVGFIPIIPTFSYTLRF